MENEARKTNCLLVAYIDRIMENQAPLATRDGASSPGRYSGGATIDMIRLTKSAAGAPITEAITKCAAARGTPRLVGANPTAGSN
jgi:hypothetical protein